MEREFAGTTGTEGMGMDAAMPGGDSGAAAPKAPGDPLAGWDGMDMEREISGLRSELAELRRKYDALYNLVVRSYALDAFAESLQRERDYVAWFELLKYCARRYLVICAVKDTPGSAMPEQILRDIQDAGFTEFCTDLWRTYVGAMCRGKEACQVFHEREEGSDWAYDALDGSLRIRATSQAYRQGNKGTIEINGIDYSVNQRGVNIVVYDLPQRKLVDSVGLDAHDGNAIHFVHLAR